MKRKKLRPKKKKKKQKKYPNDYKGSKVTKAQTNKKEPP